MADDVKPLKEEVENHNQWQFSNGCKNAIYSPALNCIIASIDGGFIEVLDLHCGQVLAKVEHDGSSNLEIRYQEDVDKVVVCDGIRLGCRGVLRECIFLESILQTGGRNDVGDGVKIELDLVQAGVLLAGFQACQSSIQSSEFSEIVEKSKQVLKQLELAYDDAVNQVKDASNVAVQWVMVSIKMDIGLLYSVFSNLMWVMKWKYPSSALPVVGDILYRLVRLQGSKRDSTLSEKSLMFSEVERYETFAFWPHKNYRWALPEPMSEAGFYHPFDSEGAIDRVMCFTCNVCLVCWEPSDQPWSEHERHSSTCPFVNKLPTENVPAAVCAATDCAQVVATKSFKVASMTTSADGLIVVIDTSGTMLIYRVMPVLKLFTKFAVSDEDIPIQFEPTTTDDGKETTKNESTGKVDDQSVKVTMRQKPQIVQKFTSYITSSACFKIQHDGKKKETRYLLLLGISYGSHQHIAIYQFVGSIETATVTRTLTSPVKDTSCPEHTEFDVNCDVCILDGFTPPEKAASLINDYLLIDNENLSQKKDAPTKDPKNDAFFLVQCLKIPDLDPSFSIKKILYSETNSLCLVCCSQEKDDNTDNESISSKIVTLNVRKHGLEFKDTNKDFNECIYDGVIIPGNSIPRHFSQFFRDKLLKSDSCDVAGIYLSSNKLQLICLDTMVVFQEVSFDQTNGILSQLLYCPNLCRMAACYDDGGVSVHDFDSKESENLALLTDIKTMPEAYEKGGITDVMHYLQFCPIPRGLHLFAPVNWTVESIYERMLPDGSPSKLSHRCHAMRADVNKGKPLPPTSPARDYKLHGLPFHISATTESYIGYLTVNISLKEKLSTQQDIFVKLYANQQSYGNDRPLSFTGGPLLCGPVKLKSCNKNNNTSTDIIFIAPQMMISKVMHLVLQLEEIQEDTDEPVSSKSALDLVSSVTIGVYQFATAEKYISSHSLLIQSVCHSSPFLKAIIDDLTLSKADLTLQEVCSSFEYLILLSQIKQWSPDEERSEFLLVIKSALPLLMERCFVNGNRSLAHRMVLLIHSISRYDNCKEKSNFMNDLERSILQLLKSIDLTTSAGPMRWLFYLLNTMTPHDQSKEVLEILEPLLIDLSSKYQKSFSHRHRDLQERFGVTSSLFNPTIFEPQMLRAPIGNEARLHMKSSQQSKEKTEKAPQPTRWFRFTGFDVLGLLEVKPLFTQVRTTSDGAQALYMCDSPLMGPWTDADELLAMSSDTPVYQSSAPTIAKPTQDHAMYETWMDEGASYQALEAHVQKMMMLSAGSSKTVTNFNSQSSKTKSELLYQSTQNDLESDASEKSYQMQQENQLCLLVERMHVASHHFVTLEFPETVCLTDVFIPRCSFLSRLTLLSWKHNQDENDAETIAVSNSISYKALTLEDCIPAIECKFIKIMVVGNHSQGTSKAVISLGQFYGHPLSKANHYTDSSKHFNDAFWGYCRFSYRLSNLLQQDANLHPEPSVFNNELADICQRVVTSQVSLATAGNSEDKSLLSKKSKDCLSQDKIRLLIECILQSIDLLSTKDTVRNDTPSWSLEICLDIFRNLCIYGPYHMTKVTNACLFSICKSNQRWPSFLAKCFEDCFGGKYPSRLVCDRVFSAFMQLIHYSVPENNVIDHFIQHMSGLISAITSNPRSCQSQNYLDWLLLMLNDILRYRDQEKWMFITPWKIICPKLRLSKFEVKSQNQNQSQNTLQKTTGPKQKSAILDKSAISNVYALVKNHKAALGWKMKHPAWKDFTENVDNLDNDIGIIGQPVPVSSAPTTAPSQTQPLSERKFNCNQLNMKDQPCIELKLSNDTKIMLCKMLVAVLLHSHSDADLSRALITCKILASLPISGSSSIALSDIVTEEKLSELLCLPLKTSEKNQKWLQHAITLALHSFVNNSFSSHSKAKQIDSSVVAGTSGTSSKVETEILNEREATLLLSEAMSSGRMRTAHQLNLVDHFGRENTFKIIEEELLASVFKPSKTLGQMICYNVIVPDSSFTLSGLVSEQLSMDYLVKSLVKLFSANSMENAKSLILQYCCSLKSNLELDDFNKNIIKELSQSKSSHYKWYYLQLFMKRLSTIQYSTKTLFDDQTKVSELCKWFSSNYDQTTKSQFDMQDVYPCLLRNLLEEGKEDSQRVTVKQMLQEELKRLSSLTDNQDPLSSISLLASVLQSNSIFTMCNYGDEITLTHDLIEQIIDVTCYSMLAKKNLIQEEIRLSASITKCFIVYRGGVIDQSDDIMQNNYISLLQLCLALLTGTVKTNSSEQPFTKTISGSYDRASSYRPLIAALDLYSSALDQHVDSKSLSLHSTSANSNPSANKHQNVVKLLSSLLTVLLGTESNTSDLFAAVKDVYFSGNNTFKLMAASSAVQKLILGAVKDDAGVNSLIESGLVALVCKRALLSPGVPLSHTNTSFSVIQNELNKQERFYAEFVGEADVSPRPPKRNDGLQNFAPYCSISGPPNCDPLDVLTKAKTSHRRIRFAAFSYKLSKDVDPWINLNIELPCVISVKEISIFMHQSYIGGCPSKVKLELSVDGEQFVPYSPILLTSGHPVIKIILANGELAKIVRLCLRAPVDLSYKLNLIELYGSTALSVEDQAISSHEDPASLKWMEVLCAASDSSSAVLTEARKYLSQDDVIKSIRLCLNSLDASQRWSALSLFVDLLWCPVNESHPPLLAFDKLLPSSSQSGLVVDDTISSTLLQELLLAYIDSDHFSKKDASRLALCLGDWTNEILKTASISQQSHGIICQYLTCVIKVLEGLQSFGFDSDDKNHSFKLDYGTVDGSLQLSSKFTSLLGLALNGLSYFQPDLLNGIISESNCDRENLLMIVSHSCQSEGNVRLLLSSKLPTTLCGDIIEILSNKMQQDDWFDEKSFVTLIVCINVLSNMFYSSHFVTLFGNNDVLHRVWEVLMVFLDSADAYRLQFISELHLEQLHILQDLSVTFFKHSIGRCHSNEVSFCQTLIRLLWKRAQDSNLHQKSFLEHLVSQLIIEERDVKVTLVPKQPISPYNRGNLRSFQMKVKETSVIGYLQEIITPSSTNRNQVTKSDDAIAWTTGNVGPDYYLYASGMAGLEKRKKNDAKKSTESKSDKNDKSKLATLLYCNDVSPLPLSPSMPIHQLISSTSDKQLSSNQLTLEYEIVRWQNGANECGDSSDDLLSKSIGSHYEHSFSQHLSLLDVFAEHGGLRLFAMNYCDLSERNNLNQSCRECLSAIGQLLLLPGYGKELLKRRKESEIILRLMLDMEELYTPDKNGKTDTIVDLVIVPYLVLNSLLLNSPLNSSHGQEVREMAFQNGIVLLVLKKLANITSENSKQPLEELPSSSSTVSETQDYWAKGTGFGTGSTTSNWNVEKSILRRKREEEHIVALLSVISSFINPCDELWHSDGDLVDVLPSDLPAVCFSSCLKDVLKNYLRNDSVLDMSRHVPLYRAVMSTVKAIVSLPALVPMVLPTIRLGPLGPLSRETSALSFFLSKMKRCIDTYTSRLKAGSSKTKVSSRRLKGPRKLHSPSPLKSNNELDESQTEQLSLLIEDINSTLAAVQVKVADYKSKQTRLQGDPKKGDDRAETNQESNSEETQKCIEADYISKIKELQFDTYEIVTEDDDGKLIFSTPYYYQQMVRSAKSDGSASRARRIAQEVASLSTSLPLSYGSSVFLRCDENRLDVMKVLITGPEDTPYANGCFEFDVYFPVDYPASPMMVNLHTTGQHSVRFNPNLYNDGKVCLSILNTWHGRPEEKWNPETSNLLQVLVSMQSLILVPDPYFNEPGYERSRGTKTGTQNSNEYNANIRQATVKWAMLEQLKKPSACFKEIIQTHFKAKSKHVIKQISLWIETTEKQATSSSVIALHLTSLKKHFELFKHELRLLEEGKTSVSTENHPSTSIAPVVAMANKLDANDDTDSLSESYDSSDPSFMFL